MRSVVADPVKGSALPEKPPVVSPVGEIPTPLVVLVPSMEVLGGTVLPRPEKLAPVVVDDPPPGIDVDDAPSTVVLVVEVAPSTVVLVVEVAPSTVVLVVEVATVVAVVEVTPPTVVVVFSSSSTVVVVACAVVVVEDPCSDVAVVLLQPHWCAVVVVDL